MEGWDRGGSLRNGCRVEPEEAGVRREYRRACVEERKQVGKTDVEGRGGGGSLMQ